MVPPLGMRLWLHRDFPDEIGVERNELALRPGHKRNSMISAESRTVANNSNNRFTTAENGTYDTVAGEAHSGAGTGTGVGATVGGIAGLLAGLGIMAIPGIGPVIAVGWLATTAMGALSWAAVAAALSPEKPNVPVPATVVMIPAVDMQRTRWLL